MSCLLNDVILTFMGRVCSNQRTGLAMRLTQARSVSSTMVDCPRSSRAQGDIPASLYATGGRASSRELVAVRTVTLSQREYRSCADWSCIWLPASDTVIEFNGLTVVQVSQNQAAVVSDPQNHVFVIKNSGFVAYGIEGTYNVLSIVDQTHLPTIIKDHITNVTLGWCVLSYPALSTLV